MRPVEASFLLDARENLCIIKTQRQRLITACRPNLRKKPLMANLRLLFLFVIAASCLISPTRAADPDTSKGSLLDKIGWTKGPAKAEVKNLAEVQVPEGFMFTGAKGTQKLLEAMGNPT